MYDTYLDVSVCFLEYWEHGVKKAEERSIAIWRNYESIHTRNQTLWRNYQWRHTRDQILCKLYVLKIIFTFPMSGPLCWYLGLKWFQLICVWIWVLQYKSIEKYINSQHQCYRNIRLPSAIVGTGLPSSMVGRKIDRQSETWQSYQMWKEMSERCMFNQCAYHWSSMSAWKKNLSSLSLS